MKVWRMAAMAAALLAAAGFWAALAPAAHGQAKIVRTQSPKLEILRAGSRIGVSIRDLEEADKSTAKGATSGVVVEEVATESPAEKAGIRKGDVIVEFDGERVRSARQLTRLVQETRSMSLRTRPVSSRSTDPASTIWATIRFASRPALPCRPHRLHPSPPQSGGTTVFSIA
jgi:S1-C subfamily serine protease